MAPPLVSVPLMAAFPAFPAHPAASPPSHAHPPTIVYPLPKPCAPVPPCRVPPTMRHPPVVPWSLHPTHSAEKARQWAAYQENGPAPGDWVEIVEQRHLARQQRWLGISDQPDIERWCVPLDGSVSLYGGGSVLPGERIGMKRLMSSTCISLLFVEARCCAVWWESLLISSPLSVE